MKDIFFLLLTFLTLVREVSAQYQLADLRDDGSIQVSVVDSMTTPMLPSEGHRYSTMNGYPKLFAADRTFKNFRNVTLVDLDKNGVDEIITGIADQLIVLSADSILWTAKLSGLARFPAAVGDLDRDGQVEIVILTGYNDDPGHIYVFLPDGQTKEGWPLTFDGRWMISSPALADIDNDDDLEIICTDLEGAEGSVYVIHHDGILYGENWPVKLPNIPAVTPSIGDINQDSSQDIIICSTQEVFAYSSNGVLLDGWPYRNEGTKYSFQSPILVDLDGDSNLEIVGEGHGDKPIYYTLDHLGSPLAGWPIPVPGQLWTFHTPTVFQMNGQATILTARPIGDITADMLYAWNVDGSQIDGFPIVQTGGHEGVTTVADIDGDDQLELLFSSNLLTPQGQGQIHAYEMDGHSMVSGFPLTLQGWTFLNGATVGDVNGDQLMDLIIQTYTEHPGNRLDTAFLHVYELGVPLDEQSIAWPTYKGNNLRNGLIDLPQVTNTNSDKKEAFLSVYPNPSSGFLQIINKSSAHQNLFVELVDSSGKVQIQTYLSKRGNLKIPSHLPAGTYFLRISDELRREAQVSKILYLGGKVP